MSIKIIDLNQSYKIIRKKLNLKIDKVLNSQKFILGEEVEKLENSLSKYLNVKYSLGVSSGTDALILALMACDIGKGDEVIVPDMTWISSVSSIILVGAKPVLADVNIEDGTIDLDKIKSKISKKTKAIIAVGLYGHLPNLVKLKKIADKNKIQLINDGAQSFGSKINGNYCHNYTSVSCTSFFPAKVLGSFGDAGACFTNSKKIYDKMKLIRSHGQSHKSYSVLLGLNARIDTIQACVVSEKLRIINKEIKKRKKVINFYKKKLSKFKNFKILSGINTTEDNGSSFVILVDKRDKFQKFLRENGVQTANLYKYSISEQPTFKKYNTKDLKISKIIAKMNVCLPCHPYLNEKDINYVCKIIEKYFNNRN